MIIIGIADKPSLVQDNSGEIYFGTYTSPHARGRPPTRIYAGLHLFHWNNTKQELTIGQGSSDQRALNVAGSRTERLRTVKLISSTSERVNFKAIRGLSIPNPENLLTPGIMSKMFNLV